MSAHASKDILANAGKNLLAQFLYIAVIVKPGSKDGSAYPTGALCQYL